MVAALKGGGGPCAIGLEIDPIHGLVHASKLSNGLSCHMATQLSVWLPDTFNLALPKNSPVNGTSASGLPADERLVSLGGSGPGARRRFPETPLTPCGGDFLTSAQTVSQSAGPGASVPCIRHGSQATDVDHRQLVYPSLERRCGRRGPARVRPSRSAGLGRERRAEARAARQDVAGRFCHSNVGSVRLS